MEDKPIEPVGESIERQRLRLTTLRLASTILLVISLIILGLSIFLSSMFSSDVVMDAPNHDYVLWFALLPGSLLLILSAALLLFIEWKSLGIGYGKSSRFKVALSLFIASAFIAGYLLNPLLSPIPFYHDSDLDSIPDYSDAFPLNASRQDRPYTGLGMGGFQLSREGGEWVVTISGNFYSCWTDCIWIKAMKWNNSIVLNLTMLSSMGGGLDYGAVRFTNVNSNDSLDAGDIFKLDRTIYTNGFRLTIGSIIGGEFRILAQVGDQ